MKRSLAIVAVLLLAALLVAQVATAVSAQPVSCAALVANPVAIQAAQELRGYAGALQNEEYDTTMGHVMTLYDLAEQLDEAPRYGCVTRQSPAQTPVTR